jgi:repressor LexA
MELTPRQLDTARAIHDYTRTRRVSPSFRDLAEALGISAPTASELIDGLEARGALTRNRSLARSIRLTPACLALLEGKRLRVEGQIAAGGLVEPGEAVAEYEEDELLGLRPGRSYYLLEVRGESMIERGIRDGDLVLMEKCQVAKAGDVVAALDEEGRATLKILRPEEGRVRLEPANSAMAPIYVRNVRIQGVLRTVIRRTP